jgi:hypothetical protein
MSSESGGSTADSGCSDHHARSALGFSRITTPSGQFAPSAIQRRSRSSCSADNGSPSFGMIA